MWRGLIRMVGRKPIPENNLTSGYYNAYAALMYYNADAYTFAFSERITPDVGMAVENGDVVRITIFRMTGLIRRLFGSRRIPSPRLR